MTFKIQAAAALWDLDGTLVESEQYWGYAEADMAQRYPGVWTHEDGLKLTGLGLQESCAIMRAQMQIEDISIEEMIQELTDGVLSHLEREVIWRPGALELATKLHDAGVPQAIVTMSIRRMALAVQKAAHEATGREIFQIVVAGDEVANGKPDPEAYLLAASRLGLDVEQCVAFEDSLNGLRSAEAANTKAVAIPNVVHIPEAEGRNIWPTLVGVEPLQLNELF